MSQGQTDTRIDGYGGPFAVFGRIVTAYDVEAAIVQTGQRWLNDYLAEIERHHGYADVLAIPRPRSWIVSAETEKMPEDQLPSIMVASPGLGADDEPHADGQGYYRAAWRIDVSAMIDARGNRNALRVARFYAGALRALYVQQQWDDIANPLDIVRVDWMDERYSLLDSIDDRTVCVGTVELRVEVANVVQRGNGPRTPSTDPPPVSPEWPAATTYALTVTKYPPETPFVDSAPVASESTTHTGP